MGFITLERVLHFAPMIFRRGHNGGEDRRPTTLRIDANPAFGKFRKEGRHRAISGEEYFRRMNSHFSFFLTAGTAGALSLLTGCVHTPPGTSVKYALAKKAELVNRPMTASASGSGVHVPAVEPELPVNSHLELVADAYSRGTFCMEAGNDGPAIEAFEEAVKLDPTFTEAWQNLAVLYERAGEEQKSLEAFQNAKNLAKH